MSGVEQFFLDMGFSWTVSKALPYILSVLLGIILIIVFKKLFRKNALLKWTIRLVLLVLPFGAYFAYSPIYEGDFSNNGEEIKRMPEHAELSGKKLVVLSIPGCPYCLESIDRMLLMHKRLPDVEIEYVVCATKDPKTTEWYQEKGGDAIHVRLAENPDAMSALALAHFPTFILVDGDKKPLKRWRNDNFGVMAMDEVELALE